MTNLVVKRFFAVLYLFGFFAVMATFVCVFFLLPLLPIGFCLPALFDYVCELILDIALPLWLPYTEVITVWCLPYHA